MDAANQELLLQELVNVLSEFKNNDIPLHETEEKITSVFNRFGINFCANGEIKVMLESFLKDFMITSSRELAEMIWENYIGLLYRGGEVK